MCNLQTYNDVIKSLGVVMGSAKIIAGDEPAVMTYNRLMRVHAISNHIISDVLPHIVDVSTRNALCVWIDAIHQITQIEEYAAQRDGGQ